MHYVHMPDSDTKTTFWERCANAYYAFQMRTKPDIQAVLDRIEAIQAADQAVQQTYEEKLAAAMVTFQGYEIAAIESIAGRTDNWRDLFEHVMLFIDQLPVADQITVMNYMFRNNRFIVGEPRFRRWMTTHTEDILDNQKD